MVRHAALHWQFSAATTSAHVQLRQHHGVGGNYLWISCLRPSVSVISTRDAQYAVLSVRSTQYAVRSTLLAGSNTQGQYVRVRCRVLVGPLAPW
jgi:hypothetical protein